MRVSEQPPGRNPIWGLPIGPVNLALLVFRWNEMWEAWDGLKNAIRERASDVKAGAADE